MIIHIGSAYARSTVDLERVACAPSEQARALDVQLGARGCKGYLYPLNQHHLVQRRLVSAQLARQHKLDHHGVAHLKLLHRT
jgi:hypothetical protein